VSYRVSYIFLTGTPIQVINPAIVVDTIAVAYLMRWRRWWTEECFSYKSMYRYRKFFTAST